MRIRARWYAAGVLTSQTLPCRVVSIGNITAGGTGKTPMTIFVAQHFQTMGFKVAVISRGYRGQLESAGGIVSDGRTLYLSSAAAGDEPYLMARVLKGIPVLVGKRRYETGRLAIERFKPDVLVFDDAFQHLKLKRDLDLVLLDCRSPFGNGYVLPRGILREPATALARANAIVFTRCTSKADLPSTGNLPDRSPIFYAAHQPVIRKTEPSGSHFLTDTTDIASLKGRTVLAFSGLADNAQFFKTLEEADCRLAHSFSFGDHHRYDAADLQRIAAMAKKKKVEAVVTTLKDFVKIESLRHQIENLVVVDAAIKMLGGGDRFCRFLFLWATEKRG